MFRNGIAVAGVTVLALAVWPWHHPTAAQPSPQTYVNFEGSPTNPVRFSPDGTRLFAVNTANASLSVFDVTTAHSPRLLAEIPVGVEPVSVNALTNDEVWVVNQVSDSISVVSVSAGMVTNTINLKVQGTANQPFAEPTDVVFASNNKQAYVSVSRSNLIAVFDTASRVLKATIPVFGGNPRALAVSPDGSLVYAAFALSGNATTIIPSPDAPPQPPPTNPALPPPPQVGLIVSISDPAWAKHNNFTMPDNDVVAINVGSTPTIKGYYSHLGTINQGLAVNPITGDLYVANTDALNLTHFETNLCAHYATNRITRVLVASGQITPFDLNPNVTYGCAPNSADLSTALAQPTGEVFDPSGNFLYVAAFGTDRVAKVDTSGNVLSFVEVSLPSGSGSNIDPAHKRGPRGLALTADGQTLYCLNRISNTLTVIDGPNNSVIEEVPVGADPTPAADKAGRGFLYDAKLSGNGTASCATCHVDGDMDHLAWDLGDPAGDMTSYQQPVGPVAVYHPMKGPMTTQTLHGLLNLTPFHWRGDKLNFAAFNGAFPALMGGNEIADSDMANFTTFINDTVFLPNPYTNIDGSFPPKIGTGDPTKGQHIFLTLAKTGDRNTCNFCHEANPGPGSNRTVKVVFHDSNTQPLKIPQLRNVYQKLLFTKAQGTSIDGFGLNHEGSAFGFNAFFNGSAFSYYTAQQHADMGAFLQCFDNGTEPTVGYTRTLTKQDVTDKIIQSDWNTLQTRAAAGANDLVARGTINGVIHGLLYRPASTNYISDAGVTYTQQQLLAFIQGGDTITIMGVYPGTGSATFATRKH